MAYSYNPDDTLDGLIEYFAYDRETARQLPNAAAVAVLVSLNDTQDAAYLQLFFFWPLGGKNCWIDCEVSNVGDTGSPIINVNPTITRKEV